MVAVILAGSIIGYGVAVLENSNEEVVELDPNEDTDMPTILEICEDCCDDVSVDPWNQSQLGIKEITWIDETTVYIRAYVSINCAYWIEGAGFRIYNNTINLTYYVGKGSMMAYCNCAHGLSFTLRNLEPGKYNFELEPTFIDHSEE